MAPEPAPAADRLGLDRGHLHHHRRRRLGRCRRTGAAGAATRHSGPGSRRGVPHHAGRRLGSGLAAARRRAVRPRVRDGRQRPGGHRQQGQDLPPVRRPDAADAGGARQGAAGDDAACRSHGTDAVRHVEPGQRCSGCRRRAPNAAPTRRTCATRRPWPPGARSSGRARRPPARRVEISTRSGNTRTPDETWSDWSSAYADAAGSPIVSPRARYLQWRAVLTATRDRRRC